MILAIDIGSNTIKCLLGHSLNGNVEKFYEETLESRISQTNSSELKQNATEIIIDAISHFILKSKASINEVCCVATSALRDSPKREEIIRTVKKSLGVEIKILTGLQEAQLSYTGALSDSSIDKKLPTAFFDLGGGSIEIVFGKDSKILSSYSFPIGAVNLTRKFISDSTGLISEVEIKNMYEFAYNTFSENFSAENFKTLVGVGGAVAAGRRLKKFFCADTKDNIITRLDFQNMLNVLAKTDSFTRSSNFGIPKGRADIIPAGFVCIMALMDYLSAEKLLHTYNNIRYGIILANGKI